MIFDILRRKFVVLTQEEWVRQHFVHFLIEQRNFPAGSIANEVTVEINGMRKRCDTVVYGPAVNPIMIVEYKAPTIKLTQQVFDQIWRYNMELQVKWLVVSNGMQHYCFFLDGQKGTYVFIGHIPMFSEL